MPTADFPELTTHHAEIAGLDALEVDVVSGSRATLMWSSTWPKVAAIGLVFVIWQIVVWSHWRPEYVLPGPREVMTRFWNDLAKPTMWQAIGTTMRRAGTGFSLAVMIGVALGLAVSRFRLLRSAVGSLITGLQTMPSVAWFPLALVLFRLSEGAIFFVVVIGAAPSIANGVISGVDHIPPLLLRAGRALGANGASAYRHVIIPAALPAVVAGVKQGWAFAWRSLMAGELLVIIANRPSIGSRLQEESSNVDHPGLLSIMILILLIGIAVDGLAFGTFERSIRTRRGIDLRE